MMDVRTMKLERERPDSRGAVWSVHASATQANDIEKLLVYVAFTMM
jgi:hypothetical protein